MHDGEDNHSEQYKQDRRRGPSFYDEAEGRARGGRVLSIR